MTEPPVATSPWGPQDEARHADAMVEAWWFWGWNQDVSAGFYVGLEITGQRFDYWAGLVRAGEPYLQIVELDSTGLRAGLDIKPPEMWAGHTCEEPFRQWSIGNEAHGVLLDDPDEAFGRSYGELVPVTFDVEWYARAEPTAIDGGYAQAGEIDAEIELREGVLKLAGPGHRVHVWNRGWVPSTPSAPTGWGLRGPYRRRDGTGIEQVLTVDGWHAWVRRAR